MLFPWTPFLFGAIWKIINGMFRSKDAETQRIGGEFSFPISPIVLFSIAWLAVPLVFFSMSGSKLPGYVLPAVPAAIILTTLFILGLIERSSRWRKVIRAIPITMLAVIVLMLIFPVPRFAETDSVKTLIEAANARGFSESRVLMVYTLSHNAEFYAPGRLLRDEAGRQRKFYHTNELLPVLTAEQGQTALVLVPMEHLAVITRDDRVKTEVIKDNTELVIAAITLK